MVITNDLLRKLEAMSIEELELAKIMKENARIAVDFCTELKDIYRFKAKENTILIAREKIKDENIPENDLKVYYNYDNHISIENKNELYFYLDISDFNSVYFCLMSKDLYGNDKYEFDKRLDKMYYDEKLAKVGVIIYDIYNALFKD